jgi:nucleotide-binding universal stress UspA family protein
MPANILVATDGKPGAQGALRLARLLADRDRSRVQVLTVFESTDLYLADSPHAVASLPPHYFPAAIEALRKRVQAQLGGIGPGAADWPVVVERGPVARTIARTAAKGDASMIVLGLRQPGSVERWLARETLLRVIYLAHVPVLAVPESMDDLPRRAVAAVDFSEFSDRAVRNVIDLLSPAGELRLAHVTWTPPWDGNLHDRTERTERTEWEETYRMGVERRLAEFAAHLAPPEGVTAETHLLSGAAGEEILRFADESHADLIAAGSHGAGFFGRVLMGSVSSRLVHGARCALLIVPPPTPTPELLLEMDDRELLANLGTAGDLALSNSPRARPGGAR